MEPSTSKEHSEKPLPDTGDDLLSLGSAFRHPVHFLALGLGSGLVPKAPGTWGSVAAVILYLIAMPWLNLEEQIAVLILSFVVGVYFCGACAEDLGVHDHGAIVWDEFVGQWMVLIFVCEYWGFSSIAAIVLSFVLFRLFDITKPWPISWADRQMHGGFGIMLDDVLAGLMAILLLGLLHLLHLLNWIIA